jgi:hypothetical protein
MSDNEIADFMVHRAAASSAGRSSGLFHADKADRRHNLKALAGFANPA